MTQVKEAAPRLLYLQWDKGLRDMNQAITGNAAFHRYRLEVIATWPENECKRAALAAAQAALQRELAFERAVRTGAASGRVDGDTRQ
jgi:hypothetical protein